MFAYFDGEFSDSSQSYTGHSGIRITWWTSRRWR
jgi:hypothetical protein